MGSDEPAMPEPTGGHSPAIRISDADRDAVVARLRGAVGEGRIDMAEFEERSSLVYAARYEGELASLVEDLPAVAAAPVVPATRASRWLVTLLGDRAWKGAWSPAPHNTAITVLGDQTVDLTGVDATEVEILALTVAGEITIVVPEGTVVDEDGFILMGSSRSKLDPPTGTPVMRVKVRSYGLIGSSIVRNPKIKKRKKLRP